MRIKCEKKLLLVGIFMMVSTAIGFSQEYRDSEADSVEVVELSLEDAKSYALEHNYSIQNASIDVQKAEASKWEMISSMLPQVSLKADYSNQLGYEMNLGGMSISMPPYGSLGLTTAVALTGAQVVGLQISNISKKMSDITLKQTEQDIANQVKVLYYSALVTEETISLLEQNVQSLDDLYQYTLKAVEVGTAEQTSADQILVQVETMKSSVNSTQRSLEMVYNSLRLLLNISAETEIVLTQEIPDLLNVDSAFSLVNQEFDVNDNYNYQLLQKSTELSKKQVDMAAWNYGPTLSLFHQYSAKHYFSDEMTMNMTPPNMIGLSISIPIFTSGKNYSTLKGAKLDYKKQLNTLQNTEKSLNIQHRQLCYNLTSAFERFNIQKQNVEVTQRVFDNISKKYQYGMASSMEVTTAGTDLVSVQSSYVQALLDFVNAQIELEKLLNK